MRNIARRPVSGGSLVCWFLGCRSSSESQKLTNTITILEVHPTWLLPSSVPAIDWQTATGVPWLQVVTTCSSGNRLVREWEPLMQASRQNLEIKAGVQDQKVK